VYDDLQIKVGAFQVLIDYDLQVYAPRKTKCNWSLSDKALPLT